MEKIILAYSGGLDTSIIIHWLKEKYGCEVIAVCADLGQGEELLSLRERALRSGAAKIYIEDLREEFVTDFIWPVLKSGAMYEGKYLLGTSFARPLISKCLVEIAHREGASAIAHGATGKGNDQVRFELAIKALDPDLRVIAPWREWDIRSREDAISYAEKHGIPVTVTRKNIYSEDRNLWHLSHEGGDLEDPWHEPSDEILRLITPPQKAPDNPTYVEIDFVKGVPVAVNGEKLPPVRLIETLNRLAGENGVGMVSLVENRLVGIKSRGVYECPGGTALYLAHRELEHLTLERRTLHFKEQIAIQYAELVYDGNWYSQLKECLDAFIDKTQETVTGTVRLKLYKGNCIPVGAKSPYSLYNPQLATFGEDDTYSHKDAEGFINLFGLPLKVRAMMEREARKRAG
ncbi:MAG: argininosuccinate synthase [Syntrophomonadaceae bacterium]|nr:argininosuccinate synthase [Syntrophomonadaceae bacterium]